VSTKPSPLHRVPNGRLREEAVARVERGLLSWHELAVAVGIRRRQRPGHRDGEGDTTRLRRMLGLVPDGHQPPCFISTLSYEKALALARALGCDPADVGL